MHMTIIIILYHALYQLQSTIIIIIVYKGVLTRCFFCTSIDKIILKLSLKLMELILHFSFANCMLNSHALPPFPDEIGTAQAYSCSYYSSKQPKDYRPPLQEDRYS